MALHHAIFITLLCYAIGCLSPSWLAVRWLGKRDLRECGTGTLGATNAGRVLGRGGYAAVALLDMVKGWGALWLAAFMGLAGWWLALAGLAAVAGHVWPAPFKFHGGKGMATAYGAVAFFSPVAAAVMWPVLGALFVLLRSATLASLATFLIVPPLFCLRGSDAPATALFIALAGLLLFTHRQNIRAALERRRLRAITP